MKKYDYVIWDFNGTILDDVEAGIRSVNTLLKERGLDTIDSVEYYRSVFRFPVIDYYKTIGFDFDSEPYDVLAPKWVALYLENVKDSGVYDDVKQTLELFNKNGVKQCVLSATEINMLTKQLMELGIYDEFEQVMGIDNIHAGSKLAPAYAWREAHRNAKVLFIGDTDHDVDAARALGADCVLVCRGHQSKEYLATLDAYVCDDLTDVREMVLGE